MDVKLFTSKDVEFAELDETHAVSWLDECSGLCGNWPNWPLQVGAS